MSAADDILTPATLASNSASPRAGWRFQTVSRIVTAAAPALATILLGAMLLITIYYTLLDWQWIAFLAGTLFAALLALASRTSHAEWKIRRRDAQLAQLKQRLTQATAARIQIEDAYRVSETRMRLISDALPIMLVYIDSGERFRFHNRAFREWIGLRDVQIDGQAIGDVLGQRMYAEIRGEVLRALSGESVTFEQTHMMSDGTLYRMSITLLPYVDNASQVSGCFGLLTDVTERKHLGGAIPDRSQETASEPERGGAPLVMSSGSGQTLYLNSITEELTGWSNPEARLRQALHLNEFRLYCQDIVPVVKEERDHRYYEILLRLQEEEQNLTPPGAFIPVAEQHNLTTDLDRWVLRNLGSFYRRMGTSRIPANWPMCSINLFGTTISDHQFLGYLDEIIAANRIPPRALCFELFESDAVERLQDAVRFTNELRKKGCRIAIGGFGGGKVSFDLLKHLQVDFVKIDGSVVRRINSDPVSLAKVKAICRVSKVIGIRTIAQFVESTDIFDILSGLGVDYAQGFGISVPRPITQLL